MTKKQKTAYEVVSVLVENGWCYRQLHECYGLSISTLRAMANNPGYQESADNRDLLNSKRPSGKPRWSKKQ